MSSSIDKRPSHTIVNWEGRDDPAHVQSVLFCIQWMSHVED